MKTFETFKAEVVWRDPELAQADDVFLRELYRERHGRGSGVVAARFGIALVSVLGVVAGAACAVAVVRGELTPASIFALAATVCFGAAVISGSILASRASS